MRPAIEVGAPRVLLVETLDAIGADAADARDRTALLRSAGACVVPLAVAGARVVGAGMTESSVVPSGAARGALRDLLSADPFDRILLASATPGGGALASLLPLDRRTFWWPTGLGFEPRGGPLRGWLGRLVGQPRLTSWWAGANPADRPAPDAPDGAGIDELRARRGALPLWDGDVVVVPEGFQGRAGRAVLEAFARLAGDWTTVDVVAWTDAPLQGDRYARRLGIEGRIHHAGAPTRKAEWAWWKHSQALVLTGSHAVSRGLLLRALASGCPVLWVGARGGLSSSIAHLSRLGCVRVVVPEPGAVAMALAQMLARDGEVELQVERARGVSVAGNREALRDSLATWLGTRTVTGARAA